MNDRTIGQWALRRIRKHTAQPLLAFVALNALFMSHDVIAQSSDRSGKDVVESVCIRCHGTGEQGAPKIGDTKAWSARASQGLTSLTQHALDGIRQMPPHGGSPDVTDIEIMRAITYMVNESGGHWVQPLSPKDMGAERSGREIVAAQCAKCHRTGEGGAPKIGDQSAWIPRMKNGIDYLVRSAIKGHGPMPSRGGLADTTDAEIRNAILYMFNPQIAGVLIPGVALIVMMLAPFIDKNPSAKPTDRKFAIALFTVFLMMWAVLVILGSFFRGPGFNFILPWKDGIFFEL